jgi:DNA invertase Pin-like site-specific DNA recombinase|tara:strand:- start:16241 stop:16831 length:591 start_codon:yes stop_codon:yes gene_type:complete
MQIGYARVSRGDSQDLDPQLRALTDAGCSIIYREEASGAKSDRPELALAIEALKPGDVLTVWKLDRLSRSLRDLLFTLEAITAAEAGFRSLTEAVDTTTPAGRLMMQTLGAFAEFERAMIRERTMNGLAHARKAGKHIGRKRALSPQQRAEIIERVENGLGSPAQLASLFRVSRSTVQRVLRDYREKLAREAAAHE